MATCGISSRWPHGPELTLRASVVLLLLLPSTLLGQQPAPRFMYIYRDSLKAGVDSAFRMIENDAAQICADFQCPNPYLALESAGGGPHEAWWLNAFATDADTARTVQAYATNRPLSEALGAIGKRKQPLIGTPIQGFGVFRPDLSRGATWSVAGAQFMVVAVTHDDRPADGWVWEMSDSTLYIFRPLRALPRGGFVVLEKGARVFAVRPNWSMPSPDWVAADPEFWRLAPAPQSRR